MLIASALHQHVEHHPGLIDGAPEPVRHTVDLEDDLIQVPLVTGASQSAADPVGERLTELAAPLPQCFVADHDAARGEQFVHHAQAEWETKVQPDGVADDLGQEAVAGVAGARGCRQRVRLLTSLLSRKSASSQVDGAAATDR